MVRIFRSRVLSPAPKRPGPRPAFRGGALLAVALAVLGGAVRSPAQAGAAVEWPQVSGRYPHLAVFNSQQECGIGAIGNWARRSWFVTYSPHEPRGSDDGLYELSPELELRRRPESVGGTAAGRMLNLRGGQLLIGRYVIDRHGEVEVISPETMPARIAAIAQHLKEPLYKAYYLDMEGRIYEVDLRDLTAELLFEKPVPGWHGKAMWTGIGVVLVANNGEVAAREFDESPYLTGGEPEGPDEAGVLAEWDGETWRIIERKQFAEVTGTGGMRGRSGIPVVWAVGWDRRSVILKTRETARGDAIWTDWRLPKSDFSYDGRHGWHTEWPRIRDVGVGPMLLNMHGGLFDMSTRFGNREREAFEPVGAYLKVISDGASFGDRIAFACNDTSLFDNPLAGQAQSNLWFTAREGLSQLGEPRGWGSLAMGDPVQADQPSAFYRFGGYRDRCVHLAHGEDRAVTFRFETQQKTGEDWVEIASVTVPPRGYAFHVFGDDDPGEWLGFEVDTDVTAATVRFHYGSTRGAAPAPDLFAGLAAVDADAGFSFGVVRPRGGGHGTLQLLAQRAGDETASYYEMGADLRLEARPGAADARAEIESIAAIPEPPFRVDAASVVFERDGVRWRLPKGDPAFDRGPVSRGLREVVTERSLLHAHGTFYVLPRDSSGGARALMPVASHDRRIVDFCSWRGMLAITGVRADADDDHVFAADDGVAVWLGDVDDLWKLGAPRGVGGPWAATAVRADEASDPYLMTGYDDKTLRLSHDADVPVHVRVEVDVDFAGWHTYRDLVVPPGVTIRHEFPDGYRAHWVRLVADRDCTASAEFTYR